MVILGTHMVGRKMTIRQSEAHQAENVRRAEVGSAFA
jgi:hypothetical protein